MKYLPKMALTLGTLALMAPPLDAQVRISRPTTTIQTTTTSGATLSTMPAGPAPVGLAVTGTPAKATATWQPAPNAVRYSIQRWLKSNPSCCRNEASNLTTTTWTDDNGMLQWSGVYVYALSVTYSDGSVGSAQIEWTRPEPTNPASITGSQKGEGVVELTWPAVAGASYYLLWGPGLADATRASATTHTVTGVPAGIHEYMVGAYFEPGPVSTPATMFTKGRVSVTSATANYRITLNGFAVNHATSEDPANWDGVSDEVYGSAFIQIFDRTTRTLLAQPRVIESRVHGDVSKWRDRVRAGSLTASGGIGPGDRVPDNSDPANLATGQPSQSTFPLVLFQGPLTLAKEVVVLRPVLWESDGNRSAYDQWYGHFMRSAPTDTYSFIQNQVETSDLRVTLGGKMLRATGSMDQLVFSRDIKPGVDRPIGLVPDGLSVAWFDHIVVLTKEKLDAALDSPYATGARGILAIPLADKDAGDLPYSGDYVLYLRVERLP